MLHDNNIILIGNPNNFAVSYSLDTDYGGKWLFGKICYHINNTIIGDWEQGTSLCTVVSDLSRINGDSHNIYYQGRKESGFFYMDTHELLKRIDEYRGNKESLYYLVANDRCYDRFNVALDDPTMVKWRVYLIEDSNKKKDFSCRARFIVLKYSELSKKYTFFFEHWILNVEFCDVVERVYHNLYRLYENELVKNTS